MSPRLVISKQVTQHGFRRNVLASPAAEDFKLWHKIFPDLPAQLCTFPDIQTFDAAESSLRLCHSPRKIRSADFNLSGEAGTAV
jgi:hypothetical protein